MTIHAGATSQEDYHGNGRWQGQREGRKRFALTMFDDLRPDTAPLFLVRDILPKTGVALIWGPPKCGKSFWTFDLMLHVAKGWTYRGRATQQGFIVYCAFEGANGYGLRAQAFRQQHDLAPGVPFALATDAMDLVADHRALIASLREQMPEGLSPAAVVLDTLNRSLHGSESSDEDMGNYIKAADAIREAFNCLVAIVHHCGHDEKRPRGHSSLRGAIDAEIAVSRDTADNIIATVERMKDGPEGEAIMSRLETVEVGSDDDGNPIRSCIVIPVDGEPTKPHARGKGLPKSARIALAALEEAINTAGEPAPASNHIPANVRTVSELLWRRYAYGRGISGPEAGERAQQQAFKRAADYLKAGGHVGIWDGTVWRA